MPARTPHCTRPHGERPQRPPGDPPDSTGLATPATKASGARGPGRIWPKMAQQPPKTQSRKRESFRGPPERSPERKACDQPMAPTNRPLKSLGRPAARLEARSRVVRRYNVCQPAAGGPQSFLIAIGPARRNCRRGPSARAAPTVPARSPRRRPGPPARKYRPGAGRDVWRG